MFGIPDKIEIEQICDKDNRMMAVKKLNKNEIQFICAKCGLQTTLTLKER